MVVVGEVPSVAVAALASVSHLMTDILATVVLPCLPHTKWSGEDGTVAAPWNVKTNALLKVRGQTPWLLLHIQQDVPFAHVHALAESILAHVQPCQMWIVDTLAAGHAPSLNHDASLDRMFVIDSRRARETGLAALSDVAYLPPPHQVCSVGSALLAHSDLLGGWARLCIAIAADLDPLTTISNVLRHTAAWAPHAPSDAVAFQSTNAVATQPIVNKWLAVRAARFISHV